MGVPLSLGSFNHKRLIYFIDRLVEGMANEHMEIYALIETITELIKFFPMFGKTLEYASADLIEKRDGLIANRQILLE